MSPLEIKVNGKNDLILNKGTSSLPGNVNVRVIDENYILSIPNIIFFEANNCLMSIRNETAVSNRINLKRGELGWEHNGSRVSVKVVE